MSTVESPTRHNAEPLLHKMQRMVGRLEALSDSFDLSILSASNPNSAATSPNASAAARSSTSRRGSTKPRTNPQAYENTNAGLNLRREHGRLVVPPEELDAVPQALPTENFYRRFPRAVGPMANVVVTSPEEYQLLLKMCDPVELVKSPHHRDVGMNRLCKEDVNEGGFFLYQPKGKHPQYFKLRVKTSTDVYGTSSYIIV